MSGRCEGPDHSWNDCPWHGVQDAGTPSTAREEDPDIHMVETRRPTRTLADLFRQGRAKGWFKSTGNYTA